MLDPDRAERLQRIKALIIAADLRLRRARNARLRGDYPQAQLHTEIADRLAHRASLLSQLHLRAETQS